MMNIKNLMKQAQEMQNKMKATQEQLAEIEVEGQAGSGLVKTIVNGKGEIKSLSISPEIVKQDEIEMLEDLIITAINDAKNKADNISEEKMSSITKGMKLPF